MEPERKILVVDDHKTVRDGLRAWLGEFGYRNVEDAPDAETALEKVLIYPPDLIIVDLNLPGRSGLDLVGDLLQLGIETTMIVLTAHGSIDSAVQATSRGRLRVPVQAGSAGAAEDGRRSGDGDERRLGARCASCGGR